MTLYYFMMRAWIHIGDSEFMLRLPSMVFGVLTVLAIYVVAARLFSQLTGLIAATALSVHGFHIAFSQIARSYSFLLFLLLLTMYLLVSAMESQSTRDWAFRLCLRSHLCAPGPGGLRGFHCPRQAVPGRTPENPFRRHSV